VVDWQSTEKKTFAILLGDGNICPAILPQAVRLERPIEIPQDFALPSLEPVAERREKNVLEKPRDMARPAELISSVRPSLAPRLIPTKGAFPRKKFTRVIFMNHTSRK
jgi:hypothetical protein